MTAVAQSTMLRDEPDAALAWADRALALADEFDLPRGPAGRAGGEGLGADRARRPPPTRAGRSCPGWSTRPRRLGEWVLAARALNNLVQGVPPTSPAEHAELLERMRVDAERAGFESLAVAAYFQGRARLAMREGDLRRGDRGARAGPRPRPRLPAPRAGGPTTTRSSWPGSTWRPGELDAGRRDHRRPARRCRS